ncbi:MAG TPA: CaiB/BaiF CoA-transferase family protein [Candidatus Saccharimonadales bacterium]|jgi:itaconate CoA-transferase|nr:CaiB/BaiF CoA-transferase family protein [Candidatus Saccharimonadales bacterium]
MNDNSPLPLTGIRVVALEQAVSAPFCSRQLADLGADVIKVERPDGGDTARGYDSAIKGISAYFAWLNRGKRSIVLDLKQPHGLHVCSRLLARADIFIHNLVPGAVERMGFGYEPLAQLHPRLIWCGISGYGPDGPYREKRAYDMLVQAEAGVVSLTGSPGAPAKVGISMADISSGLYGHSSILAALLQRERTGKGDRIDISMLECLTEWMMPPLYVWLGAGAVLARAGMRHNMIVPYGAYACADGAVMFAIQHDREWQSFCNHVLAMPGLAADPRFATNANRLQNRVELESLMEDHFARHTRVEVQSWLEQAGIPTGMVNDVPTVATHPQLAARGRWVEVDSPAGAIPALLPPHNLQNAPPQMGAVPALGEHTREILAELGIEGAEG